MADSAIMSESKKVHKMSIQTASHVSMAILPHCGSHGPFHAQVYWPMLRRPLGAGHPRWPARGPIMEALIVTGDNQNHEPHILSAFLSNKQIKIDKLFRTTTKLVFFHTDREFFIGSFLIE